MDPFVVTPIIVTLGGIVIAIVVLVAAVKGIAEWSYNNGQPILTARARVIAKRMDVRTSHSIHNSNDHFHHDGTRTHYYVTFELESGERREIAVSGPEYGILVEGDVGTFTYQGTRYKGFARGSWA